MVHEASWRDGHTIEYNATDLSTAGYLVVVTVDVWWSLNGSACLEITAGAGVTSIPLAVPPVPVGWEGEVRTARFGCPRSERNKGTEPKMYV